MSLDFDPDLATRHMAQQEAEIAEERAIADALCAHAEDHQRTADRIEGQLRALRELIASRTAPQPTEEGES